MIVLDTHALVWWLSQPARVGRKALRALDGALSEGTPIAVSSISLWEIAMLVQRGRIELTIPFDVWLSHVEDLPFLSFVPVDNRIAVRSVQLEKFPHRDPADRMIVATALSMSAPLVTADDRLRAYKPLKTIWD